MLQRKLIQSLELIELQLIRFKKEIELLKKEGRYSEIQILEKDEIPYLEKRKQRFVKMI
jgi:hypothetical protein